MEYTAGKIVRGTVTGIESYGAFVSLDDFYTGLIHISEISNGYVRNITDFVNVGDHIYVKIISVDEEEAHLNLSIKDINYKIKRKIRRKRIIETKNGFNTLAYNLPRWVEKKLKSMENTIDKK